MARICQITGKKSLKGNNVAHSKRRTTREFAPNLRVKKFWSEEEQRYITLRLTAAGIRNICKNGLAASIKKAQAKGLIDLV